MKSNYWFSTCIAIICLSLKCILIAQEEDFIIEVTPSPEITVEEIKPLAPEDLKDITIPIEIPYLGTVSLIRFTEKEETGFKAKLPATNAKLELGPLVIDQGELKMIGDKISYSAGANLFGAKTRIGGEFNEKDATFSLILTFDEKPKVNVLGKELVLESGKAVFDRSKPNQVRLVASTSLFNQPVDLSFIVDKTKSTTDLEVQLKGVKLKEIVPPTGGTSIGDAPTNFTLTIKNFIAYKQDVKAVLKGKADFSGVPQLANQPGLADAQITAEFSGAYFNFTADLNKITVPVVGDIDGAKIVATVSQDTKSLSLIGKADINIPTIDVLPIDINSEITTKGINFSGDITKNITFAGITITGAKINFSTQQGTINIIGSATIKDQPVIVTIERNAKGEISAAGVVEKATPLTIISEFSLVPKSVKFVKSATGYETQLMGTVSLFNVPLEGELHVKQSDGKQVLLAVVKAPPGYKLSDSVPVFKGNIFGDITLNNLHFVVSNADYTEPASKLAYKSGLNFYANTTLSGPLKVVGDLTASVDAPLTISGYLNASDPLASSFKAHLPKGIPFDIPNVKIGPLTLEIQGKPVPSFYLVTNAIVTAGSDQLNFTSRIGFAPPTATLAGTMAGTWVNPLGASGITIGNVALEINFTLPPSIPTTKVGVTGALCLSGSMAKDSKNCRSAQGASEKTCGAPGTGLCGGGVGACMAVKFPELLSGEVDKFYLEDIVKFAASLMKKDFDVKKYVPQYGMECVKLYIAPKETTIGELTFERGFNLTGKLKVLGSEAFLSARAASDGLFVHGTLSNIEIPKGGALLQVSGTGGKPKPELKIELGVKEGKPAFLFFIDGQIKIASIYSQAAHMDVSPSGVNFEFTSELGGGAFKTKDGQPLLLSTVKGTTASSPIDFTLEIIFKQYLFKWITEQVNEKFNAAKQEVNAALGSAQQEIDKIDGVIAQAQAKIKEAEEKVASARRAVDSINKAIDESNATFNKAKAEVDSIESEIKKLTDWYYSLPKV